MSFHILSSKASKFRLWTLRCKTENIFDHDSQYAWCRISKSVDHEIKIEVIIHFEYWNMNYIFHCSINRLSISINLVQSGTKKLFWKRKACGIIICSLFGFQHENSNLWFTITHFIEPNAKCQMRPTCTARNANCRVYMRRWRISNTAEW